METNLRALRAKIKGFCAESTSVRKDINRSRDQKKARLWDEKRSLGSVAREHLIAYALLRGKKYEELERKCRPGNEPHCSVILKLIHEHASAKDRREWTEQRVKDALTRAAS